MRAGDVARIPNYDSGWVGGVDSLLNPADVQPGRYSWLVNGINRGGIIQTRPKKRRLFSVVGQNAQGLISFRTYDGTWYLVFCVDGLGFYSQFPFTSYQQIPVLKFSASATRIYMEVGIQDITYDSQQNIVQLPNPVYTVFFNDGISAPGWWDGTNASQPTPTYTVQGSNTIPTSLPIGTAMAFSGNRLWVASDHFVYASDLFYPQSFTEGTYVAEASGFRFPDPVTSFLSIPNNGGMYVFTDQGVYSLMTNQQTRSSWQTTQGFQSTITEEFGNVAPFAPIYLHGLPWIFTERGLISLDQALNDYRTSTITSQDGEMERSKRLLSTDITGICTGVFENMLMVSVPYCSLFNRHTWIMDGSINSKLSTYGQSTPVWSGVWTGTYPVQYANVLQGGIQHNYELSYSAGQIAYPDGTSRGIHIWENFIQYYPGDDYNTPVRCSFETRLITNQSTTSFEELMRCAYLEFTGVKLEGTVAIELYIAGMAGLYKLISSGTLRADVGPFGSPENPIMYYKVSGQQTTILQSYKKQDRWFRSEEIKWNDGQTSAHFTEVGLQDGIDKGFQVCVKWTGNFGFRSIKLYTMNQSERGVGKMMPQEGSTQSVVLDTGDSSPILTP